HPIVVVVSNFTPVPRQGYALPLPVAGRWREIINTDAHAYGGSDLGNFGAVTAEDRPLNGKPAQAQVTLPPLATLYFMQDN
uniref:alpha amylase C-terminal domain-containing protein n=1 Tax=Aestuariivirga sp. TaxID=2650926 RepID=UPI0035B3F0F6